VRAVLSRLDMKMCAMAIAVTLDAAIDASSAAASPAPAPGVTVSVLARLVIEHAKALLDVCLVCVVPCKLKPLSC
jgi:hypothetical protein